MTSPEFKYSANDTIIIGTECADTNQTVCYFYKPEQAAAIICLLKSDFRSGRICLSCCKDMIDRVSTMYAEEEYE